MGKKIKSIEKLDYLGLNHHLMCITRNVKEAIEFAKAYPKGSIRTDWVVESGYNLPLYSERSPLQRNTGDSGQWKICSG